ncbi:MAG TPA: hypothetical protein VNG53_09355 [Bacteroidia bacterium]|nr:hypothetical protein [Bacteroidia bacterium]
MFKNIASTFVIKLINALIGLLVAIVISQNMGAFGKGETSLIITSVTLVLILCNVVGGATVVYLVPRYPVVQILLPGYLWSVVTCAAAYFVLSIFPLIPEAFVVHVVALSLLSSFMSINLTILLGKEKITANNLISLLQTIINLLVLLGMIYFLNKQNVMSYIIALYVSFGSCFLISFFLILPYLKNNFFKGQMAVLKETFRVGLLNQSAHVIQFINLRLSFYLLSHFSGDSKLGVYSNAIAISGAIWLISNSIATIQYARIANSTDRNYSRMLTLKLTKASFLLCLFAVLPLFILPDSFYIFIFGKDFGETGKAIWTLIPGILCWNISLIIGHYFSGIGKYQINTFSALGGVFITILMSILFIHHYTIFMAGIISSCSYFASAAFIMAFYLRDTKYSFAKFIPEKEDFIFIKKELIYFLRLKKEKV